MIQTHYITYTQLQTKKEKNISSAFLIKKKKEKEKGEKPQILAKLKRINSYLKIKNE